MNTQHSGTAPQSDIRNAILAELEDGMDDLQQAIEAATLETVEKQQLQLR